MSILLAVAALALVAFGIFTLLSTRAVLSYMTERSPTPSERVPSTWTHDHISKLERDVENLTVAVSEGIAGYKRHENRIQKTVTSARRIVRDAGLEHAGIEAEFAELQPPDGEGIEPLPPVLEEVDKGRTVRIPGGHLTIGVAS